MTIDVSTFVVGHAEADGRRYVAETHTDHTGAVYSMEYLAPVGADYAAIAVARATALAAQLAEDEAAALLN